MSARSAIIDEFQRVAREHDKKIADLTEETVLSNSGLDSLCFAIVVARLEDILGVDPFTAAEELAFPTTLGEFIGLYETAAA